MTAVLDVSRTPRTPFHRLVLVELRKTYDTRAGFWLLAVIGLIVLATEVIALVVTTVQNEAIAFGDFIGAAAFMTSFLLPVLLMLLERAGIVTRAQLVAGRRYAIVGATVVAAVLTPPDVVSQLMLAIPLILLYEAALIGIWFTERKRAREAPALPAETPAS